jgi:3,5-epimerase/4-reductase
MGNIYLKLQMESSKILIFGKGYISSRIAKEINGDVSDRRINSFTDAQEEVEKYKPTVILNCIGHTGKNNVDDCEIDPDKNLISNTIVPIILAEVALRNNIKLIHISSGCIYNYNYHNHQPPINEEMIPDFFGLFYSRSKIYSERALETLSKQYPILILRIRIPLDDRSHPKNILNKLIEYRNIIDVPNSLTYIPDFIKALKHLINIDARGIYNVVNKDTLRYPKLMNIYKKHVPEFNYKIINLNELGLVRTNIILSTKKLEESGFKIRSIHEVLDECVQSFLKESI